MTFNNYWPVYKNLEEETVELTKYIQFTDDQLTVYSMHIADLLVRCAMEIESLSKELYWKNGGIKVYNDNGTERQLYFDTDCLEYLNNIWNLSEKYVLVSSSRLNFEKKEHKILKPMYNAHKRSGAKWNKAYQAVKHDRKKCLKYGNIKHLLSAMAALFMLNIYYSDQTFDYGTISNPNKMFDNRLGSDLFAASIADATIGITIGDSMTDSSIQNKTKEQINSSMCIIKYTSTSWKKINDALETDVKRHLNVLEKSKSYNDYITQHPDKAPEIESENLLSLLTKFLGEEYIHQHNLFGNFGMEYMKANKEVVVNKKQILYG